MVPILNTDSTPTIMTINIRAQKWARHYGKLMRSKIRQADNGTRNRTPKTTSATVTVSMCTQIYLANKTSRNEVQPRRSGVPKSTLTPRGRSTNAPIRYHTVQNFTAAFNLATHSEKKICTGLGKVVRGFNGSMLVWNQSVKGRCKAAEQTNAAIKYSPVSLGPR